MIPKPTLGNTFPLMLALMGSGSTVVSAAMSAW